MRHGDYCFQDQLGLSLEKKGDYKGGSYDSQNYTYDPDTEQDQEKLF